MSAEPENNRAVSKPLLYTLAGVVVLALVGVFVIMPLMAPEEVVEEPVAVVDPAEPGAEPAEPGAEPGEEPAAEIEEELEALPPVGETFEVFSARDPFNQLVSEDTGGDVAVVGGDPASDDGSDDGGDTDDGETDGGDDGDTPPESTTEDGTTVVVEDVFTDDGTEYVLLTANDTAYTLTEGDTFASNWRVEAIDDPCVTLLYGDQARLVCEGESIRK